MPGIPHLLSLALLALAAGACQPAADRAPDTAGQSAAAPVASGDSDAVSTDGATFAAIGAEETISFVGTEPFWGGEVAAGKLTYSTPENQAGETISVRRFAGNNGLGFSGALGGAAFDMAVTPGACSDGMSDRSYPFTVTLTIGAEQRRGCAWTRRQPFTGDPQP